MKRFAVFPLLLLFAVALAGCQTMSFGEKTAHAREAGLQVILFYDESSSNQPESVYFNALLDEINHALLDRDQITIHSGHAASLTSRYHLNDCPAIIVKYNGVEKTRIEGEENINTILNKLNHAIQSHS
ncbi:MAG TPA: hypothetical protein VFK37_09600 [Bacillales bacterium]|nr:hypothetical protein [Bacillales bacterium]